VEEPVIKKRIK